MGLDRDAAPPSEPTASPAAEVEELTDAGPSRRRLFKLAVTATPVIAAMGSRPAWACNPMMPSVFSSIYQAQLKHVSLSHDPSKTSKPPGTGCSQNYWKCFYKQESSWSCAHSDYGNNNLVHDNATFQSCIKSPKAPAVTFGHLFNNGGSDSDCRYAAHYLNSINNGGAGSCHVSGYPITTTDLCRMYNGTFNVGGGVWSQDECLKYLEALEDDSKGVIPTGIKFY